MAAFIAVLTYQYLMHRHMLRSADVRIQSTHSKAGECSSQPTSSCFAELAVLHMSPFTKFTEFSRLASNLRYLGFGEVVDASTPDGERQFAADELEAYRQYVLVTQDPERFASAPPAADPFVYSKASYRLDPDYVDFAGGGNGDVKSAEEAAQKRRGMTPVTPAQEAMLRKWRESLELYADSSLDWLFYTSRARTMGKHDEARDALQTALGYTVSPTSEWTVVYESWQLNGLEAGLAAIAALPETNRRAGAYLNMANRLFNSGNVKAAESAYRMFEESFDENEKFRLATQPRRLARSAALLAYRLYGTDAAMDWAERYANGHAFLSVANNALQATELFAEIGAADRVVIEVETAIANAPEPGKTARGPWLSTVSTTGYHNSYVGRSAGALCRVGKLDEAFAITAGKPWYGENAISGCRKTIEGDNPALTLDELADKLALRSKRELELFHAAALVRDGDYELASEYIRDALNTVVADARASRAFRNLSYLRLAIAMRDEALTKDVMRAIVADGVMTSGDEAVSLFTSVAILTQRWP